ncbi:MAG: metallophosphoesterase [Methanobrevibacter sp.]|nr:metallophosphoesterase [Methanobrevibacter sp.]
MTYYIVSDVHGFFNILKEALDDAGFDKNNPGHIFVSLGDLLDRGKQPRECLQFVNSLERKILIRGNHEDLMEDMLDAGYPRAHDLHNGTYDTIIDLKRNSIDDEFEAMKNDKDYNDYISSIIDYFETKTAIFVHGWIPCFYWESWSGVSHEWSKNEKWREVHDWKPYRWLNGMEAWKSGIREKNKTIFCGHWHTSFGNYRYHQSGDCEFGKTADFGPFIDTGIVALDACTSFSKKINVYVLEEN